MNSFYHETFSLDEQLPMQMHLHRGSVNYIILEHWHRSLEIDYLIDCQAILYINGKKKLAGEGSIVLVNSGDIHALEPVGVPQGPESAIHGVSLFISYEFLKKICPEFDEISFELEGQEEKQEELRHLFDELLELYLSQDEKYGYLKMDGLLLQVIYLLCANFIKEKSGAMVRSQKYIDRIRKVLDYMEKHYEEPLTLQGVAGHFCLSMEYLARVMKKYTGNTFKAHLNQIRVSKAYKDLMETDYSMLEIAMRNGFPDARSFISVFKDAYGMTPNSYRKKNSRKDLKTSGEYAENMPHIRVMEEK